MKLKNNKGFAITALLYGLSIMALMTVVLMMSIIQNTRKNNTTTVKTVEQELNSYGQSAADYSGGNPTFEVPTGQSGYYKIELSTKTQGVSSPNKPSMVSGTVYLEEGTKVQIALDSPTDPEVKIEGEDFMRASTTEAYNYVIGMAKSVTDSDDLKIPRALNGQIFFGSTGGQIDKATARVNKVSAEEPQPVHTHLDKVGCIKTNTKAVISAVGYKLKNGTTIKRMVTGTSSETKLQLGSNNVQLSEIYIKLIDEKSGPTVTIYSDNGCTSVVKTINSSTSYTYQAGTESTISRYSPVDFNITTGNYGISILDNTFGSSPKHKSNDAMTFKTSAYTPSHDPRNPVDTNLILFGSSSIARPVLIDTYKGLNSQKWRIEETEAPGLDKNKYKRVSEIEEYKPFAVNTGGEDTTTGTGGPVLICGVYKWQDGFVSTDSYTQNRNQQWEFVPAGLGFYALKTNSDINGDRNHIYCNHATGLNNRCYITLNAADADLFKVFNANL